jgi:hypothetical protein
MIHSVPRTDRVVAPWPLLSRSFDWLGQTGTAVLHWAMLCCGLIYEMPDVRMSEDWLSEHEHQSAKHPDDV